MAEYTVQKALGETDNKTSAVFTGDAGKQLFPALRKLAIKAVRIEIMVAYTRESGVRLMLPVLLEAAKNGAAITLLTGTNFNLTEPQALYLLRYYLGDKVELRFYKDEKRNFHPKAYFLHFATHSYLFVGSSNLSASALGGAVEWNYRLDSRDKPQEYQEFYWTFQHIYDHHSILVDEDKLRQYARTWQKSPLWSVKIS